MDNTVRLRRSSGAAGANVNVIVVQRIEDMVANFGSIQNELHGKELATPKVVLLTDSPAFAGTERHILDLARGLLSIGVPVIIASPTASSLENKSKELGIPTASAPKSSFPVKIVLVLVDLLKSKRADVIHAHNGVTHLLATFAIALAGRGQCVATQHFLEPNRASRRGVKAALANKLHDWACQRTARFISVSHAVDQSCAKYCKPGASTTIHHGIFPPQVINKSNAEVRQGLGIEPSTPLVVAVSRLEAEKSVDVLVNAMPELIKQIPNAVCVIAGEGSEEQRLTDLIATNNLSQSVRLLGFRDDAMNLMKAADVFVLTCPCESFGLVLLEAMWVGTPVIAAAAGGPAEVVNDNVTGLLFAPGDHVMLAQKIACLLKDRLLSESLNKAAHKSLDERFSAERMTEQTAAVYKQAVLNGAR